MIRDSARRSFSHMGSELTYYSLDALEEAGLCRVSDLPYSIRVLVENILRNEDGFVAGDEDVERIARWRPGAGVDDDELPFRASRVLLQDFTGVPAIVDLAAMRSAVKKWGGDIGEVNPQVPVDLVIDHSVQVDYFGNTMAFTLNLEREFERNVERYRFLKWAQRAFQNLRVIPPGRGIVHQVNIEYLAKVVDVRSMDGRMTAFPDTVLGTDSHTPMVNALGVLGWGVGGIEAEAVMLGQPYYMTVPEVVGVRLEGELPEGATATDLVLTITEMLRRHGVVGKFVEYFGPGLRMLSIPDRATIANMAPEYGATVGYFPIDAETLSYLRMTGRSGEHIGIVERYTRLQGLFYDEAAVPRYSEVVRLDMGEVEPSIAGPANPEDRIPLREAKKRFLKIMEDYFRRNGVQAEAVDGTIWFDGGGGGQVVRRESPKFHVRVGGRESEVGHGSVVISAITSCTNTSNPMVMVGAGLLAKKAVERGLGVAAHVKTSLAPGSMVVTEYLEAAGLAWYLEQLGYNLVGYGCTTCIGNSGPLPEPVAEAIRRNNLYTVAVLSGNRNFEGRIHPLVRASFLMSPMLVVAYGLAGRMDVDILGEPLGVDGSGRPVYLRDIWPSMDEIRRVVVETVKPEIFQRRYAEILEGGERWERLEAPTSMDYVWGDSTYVREPPYFQGVDASPEQPSDIVGARVLALLGDRITTDHISPAGAIPPNSPAGKYLIEHGVDPVEFNTYGARRGNHEVMIRGTFANPRLRNLLADREGWWTIHLPDGTITTMFDAAERYRSEGVPLIVLAGKMYGAGSSRDWAAKGTRLLGVRAVIAESYERIHRSNLVGMGVLPLQFEEGEGWKTLGLTGRETFDILGISDGLESRKRLRVVARSDDGSVKEFWVTARLDTKIEVEYYRHGGILQYVLRKMMSKRT
ncbi:MAG: aconitate hydratase AcnA [Nitrososphaerota archaeon]